MSKSLIAAPGSPAPISPVRATFAALALATLLPALGTSVANVALPTLSEAFGASFQQVQWVVLAYLLATTSLIVGAGRLGDVVGRRRLLIGGIALFTAASILCGVAPNLWLLIAGRALQGVGAAVMMALSLALAGEAAPKARIGSIIGLLGTMSAIGTALGPSLGGVMIAGSGWRAIFLINLPLGVLALLLVHRHVPRDRRRPGTDRASFDVAGTVLLALTLATYALAVTIGRGSFGPLNIALLMAAGVGSALFAITQARTASPLIQIAMLRDRGLGASLATHALVSTVMMATLVVGPFYLAGALGLDSFLVGLAMSSGPLVAALAGVPSGRLVDRIGARPAILIGLAGVAGGCFTLSLMPTAAGLAGYIAPLVVLTAGYALFQTANASAVMADVGADRRGVMSGLLNLSRNVGLITGASVMGAVFAGASRTSDLANAHPEAVAAGMRTTFALAALLIAGALAIAAPGIARAGVRPRAGTPS